MGDEVELPDDHRSALLLSRKVLPGVFSYKMGVIYGLAFPDDPTVLRAHTSMGDTLMLKGVCQKMIGLNARVVE